MDWYDVKFLESPGNLKGFIKESLGREPSTNISTNISTEISTCLQQGRLFFEAAENSPLEIKPLQVFYGVVGFSKALVSARSISSIETLAKTHGLKDKSDSNALLENLLVTIGNKGTFQHFNDSICELESINYLGKENQTLKIHKSTSKANLLTGKSLTLKTILSRIPDLAELYKKTFKEESECLYFSFYNHNNDLVDIRIDHLVIFKDRESLKILVTELRARYPFLVNWTLSTAERCWDKSILIFSNIECQPIDEFNESRLIEAHGKFNSRADVKDILPFSDLFPPLSGGVGRRNQNYINPVEGAFVSEHSVMYLGTFLLSSLVRYRPYIWVHSIRGRATQQRISDDQCMAIIEKFLNLTLSDFPRFVVDAMRVKIKVASQQHSPPSLTAGEYIWAAKGGPESKGIGGRDESEWVADMERNPQAFPASPLFLPPALKYHPAEANGVLPQ